MQQEEIKLFLSHNSSSKLGQENIHANWIEYGDKQ